MTSKKNDKASSIGTMTALKIGSRVRCRDDGVEGRIVWANSASVKIQWDDGEQVTWRRDSLTERPIEILDHASEGDQASTNAVAIEVEPTIPAETLPDVPATASPTPESAPLESESAGTESAPPEGPHPVSATAHEPTVPNLSDGTAEGSSKAKRLRKEPSTPKEKKFSALDAAAQVLAEEGKPMSCQELIAVMSAKGYWSSPVGRTPHATLYSAIAREITVKGTASRFVKTDKGKFARTGAA